MNLQSLSHPRCAESLNVVNAWKFDLERFLYITKCFHTNFNNFF